ncbi:MAG: hypothetical protein AAF950_18465 [Pseudomonadota bacterium]
MSGPTGSRKSESYGGIFTFKVGLLVSVILGALWGLLMANAAIDHNPHDIYWDSKTGEFTNLLGVFGIFFGWFVAIQAVHLSVSAIVALAYIVATKFTREN